MPSYFKNRRLRGSVGNDLQSRFMTPYDVDWGFLVNFNHDFMGKAELEKIAQNQSRKIVTLEWNEEEVGHAYCNQLDGEAVDPEDRIKERPTDLYRTSDGWKHRADKGTLQGKHSGSRENRR